MFYQIIKFILLATIAGYAALLLVLVLWQEKLIFPGSKLPDNHKFRPLSGLQETTVEVDGATLSALHFQQDDARGLIFFLHGNAGNLDSWVPDVDFYRQTKYDLFMIDYRGYGKSSGKIQSQKQMEEDVLIAWKSIAPTYHKRQLPVVIYGRSIGSYFALQLASQVNTELLVLVSPFTSLVDIARKQFPWAPKQILRYPLRNDQLIGQLQIPILILHGNYDAIIPVEQGRLLSEKSDNANFVVIHGASHNDIHDFAQYESVLADALLAKQATNRQLTGKPVIKGKTL